MRRTSSMAVLGVLVAGWLLLSVPDGVTGYDILAGAAAAGAGLLAGLLWPALQQHGRRLLAIASDLLDDEAGGATGHPSPGVNADRSPTSDSDPWREGGPVDRSAASAAQPVIVTGAGEGEALKGDPDRLDPRAAPHAMAAVLRHVADSLGALRIVVWRLDREDDTIVPEHGTGPLPPATAAAGSPMVWAIQQGSALRLQPTPRWADGPVTLAPIDDDRILAVETALDGTDPDTLRDSALAAARGILAPFLRLYDQQTDAAAANDRLERVTEFLRSASRDNATAATAGDAAAALARTTMAITGGAGALVASWDGERGVVHVREGAGGGPAVGTEFTVLDGDLAHAARTRAIIRREPGDRGPALACASERWGWPAPAYRTVIPLVDPNADTTGLLALWGRAAPAEQGLALLHAIAPLLALQIRQADDVVRLRDRAHVDALTALPNRTALEERIGEETARYHRYRRPVALLVVDLDHFKAVNDTHGHEAGDAALVQAAAAIRSAVRDVDFPARFGGEEMVVLLPETMLTAAMDAAERVRAAVEGMRVEVERQVIPVTASIGVSACPECVDSPVELFASADAALYAAKEAGRNRVAAADTVPAGGSGG